MTTKLEFNKSFYDEQWRHGWKSRFMYDPISKRKIAQYILQQAGFKDGNKKVLDIGFGFGLILFTFDKSDSIAGVEVSQSAVDYARRQASLRGFRETRFLLYAGEGAIELPDDSFDLIICSHVLEHVPDDAALLIDIKRLLKPNGIAFLNVPINEEHFPDPRHMRKYTPASFLKKVEENGLHVLQSYQGDKLWNTFGWFFEKDYHNSIPVLGFVISSGLNIFFSSVPFGIQRWFEELFCRHLPPRQYAVCATKR